MAVHPHQAVITTRITRSRAVFESVAAQDGVINTGFLKTQVPYALAGLVFGIYKNLSHTGYTFTLPAGQTIVNWSGANITVVDGDILSIRPGPLWSTGARIGPKTWTQLNVDDGLPTEYGGNSTTSITFDGTDAGETRTFVFTELSLAYQVGARVVLQPTTDLTTSFSGVIVDRISGSEFEVEIEAVEGAGGTFASWTMNIAGLIGPQGIPGVDGDDGTNGTNGSSVLHGAGAPTGGDGLDDDFWIRTSNYNIYGPKAAGAWGAGTSLVGPQGVAGAGVPVGGAAYQKLSKVSGTDYDTQWVTELEHLTVAASDETTNLSTASNPKLTFRMPYAFRCTEVRISVNTAPTGASIIVDVNNNGSTLFVTGSGGVRPNIDATEKTSVTGTAMVFETGVTFRDFADDDEVTIDIDQVGSSVTGKGLKVMLLGHRKS